jgi:hypothetical protein
MFGNRCPPAVVVRAPVMRPDVWRSFFPWAIAFSVLGGPACLRQAAGPNGDLAQPSKPTVTFPGAGELASLPSLPPPDESVSPTGVPVDRWALNATPPAGDGLPAEDTSPWGAIAQSAAQAHPGQARVSPAMRCAALETARFFVEKQGLPTESLRRFLVARCGGTSPDTRVFFYAFTDAAALSDDALLAKSRGPVAEQLERLLKDGPPQVIGLAAYRSKDRFAVAGLVGADPVTLEPVAPAPDDPRRVVLRGTLRSPAADAVALVNQGDFGFASCAPDPGVHLPAFSFTCTLAPGDSYAWAQILVRRAGRVLDDAAADVILYGGDPARTEYRAGPTAGDEVQPAGDFKARLVMAINAVRGRGGLAPLTVAAKQSDSDARVVGTMLDATFKHRGTDADRIALGMLAGWDVEGTIREGRLFMGFAVEGHDPAAWVDFALERPFGRAALLDPAARRVAVAPALPKSAGGVGAVVTTYSMFDSTDHDTDTEVLARRLVEARHALGRPLLTRLEHVRSLDEQSRRVLEGAVEPGAALNTAMQTLADQSAGSRVLGFLSEGNDLEHAPLPDVLLSAPAGKWAIAVTHHRVKGAAWGQYVIFWLLVSDGGGPSVQT